MINLGLSGEFNVILKNKNDEIKSETGFQKNLILDSFFTTVASTNAFYNLRFKVGTGTTPVAPTQTDLVNMVATAGVTDVSSFSTDGTTWTCTTTYTATFDLGSVVAAISELGLFFGGGSDRLTSKVVTRALIKDSEGNPTTITVTSEDQLVVIYRLVASGSEQDITGSITLENSNTTHSFIIRRSFSGNMTIPRIVFGEYGFDYVYGPTNFNFGGVGTHPTASNTSTMSCITTRPTTNTIQWSTEAGTSLGNVSGGVKGMTGSIGGFKISFDPPIPKDNTKIFKLVCTHTINRA